MNFTETETDFLLAVSVMKINEGLMGIRPNSSETRPKLYRNRSRMSNM